MWTRYDLKQRGKFRFKANYLPSVLAAFIVLLGTTSMSGSASKNSSDIVDKVGDMDLLVALATVVMVIIGAVFAMVIAFVIKVFVINPLVVGGYRFFVLNHDDESTSVKNILFGFNKEYYTNIVKIMFFKDLYVFLWSLLFVIPGIVKGYEYRMIPFLLAENPYITVEEAFLVTKGMMTGNKLDAWVLDLSFIGWFILTAITAGIVGVFYVNPYYVATNTELYFALKEA